MGARSKRLDPQGWRLAEHSRTLSQWARNVAMQKGIKYCINDARCDPEHRLSKDEQEWLNKSQGDLDQFIRSLKGASSCTDERGSGANTVSNLTTVPEIVKDDKLGHGLDDSRASQPPGASTGEG